MKHIKVTIKWETKHSCILQGHKNLPNDNSVKIIQNINITVQMDIIGNMITSWEEEKYAELK